MAANNKKILFSHFTPSQTRRCKKFVEINKRGRIKQYRLKQDLLKRLSRRLKVLVRITRVLKASVNSYYYLTSPKSGVKS